MWQGLHPAWDRSCSASSKRLFVALLPLGRLGPQPSVWKLHTWGGKAWRTRGWVCCCEGVAACPLLASWIRIVCGTQPVALPPYSVATYLGIEWLGPWVP